MPLINGNANGQTRRCRRKPEPSSGVVTPTAPAPLSAPGRMRGGTVLWVTLAVVAQESVWNFSDAQVPTQLRHYLTSAGLVGLFMGLDNVLGVFVQPWTGHLSDRHARGRRGRWPIILVGASLASVPFALIPRAGSLPVLRDPPAPDAGHARPVLDVPRPPPRHGRPARPGRNPASPRPAGHDGRGDSLPVGRRQGPGPRPHRRQGAPDDRHLLLRRDVVGPAFPAHPVRHRGPGAVARRGRGAGAARRGRLSLRRRPARVRLRPAGPDPGDPVRRRPVRRRTAGRGPLPHTGRHGGRDGRGFDRLRRVRGQRAGRALEPGPRQPGPGHLHRPLHGGLRLRDGVRPRAREP